MHKKRVFVSFDEGWVLKHIHDDVLPMNAFITACRDSYKESLQVEHSAPMKCILLLETEESKQDINVRFYEIIKDTFGDEIPDKSVDMKMEDVSEPQAENALPKKTEMSVTDVLKKQSPEKVTVQSQIHDLIGAAEFKKLCGEIQMLAPRMIKRDCCECVNHQSYLFSINDGEGLSTYLSIFADLLEEEKLVTFSKTHRIREFVLAAPKNPLEDPLLSVLSDIAEPAKNVSSLCCIDLSDWMDHIFDIDFRRFLIRLESLADRIIFVFRIPYVEKGVVRQVNELLEDILTVRLVTFMPMSMEEYQECASRKIKNLNFAVDKSVWPYFSQRISAEKSDGRFYGINTVHKVVREMIYLKLLSDTENKRDNKEITGKDIAAISSVYKDDKKSGLEILDEMVGMEKIRTGILEMLSQINIMRTKESLGSPCIHMRFVGGPGTGKTTVARVIGKIFKENGILEKGGFFEYSGRNLCGRYVGETAPKTAGICRDAYGSVLFIDEAYSLYRTDTSGADYGREALDTLIAEMENHRSNLVVIMAGYSDEMHDLMQGNRGLESRMPYVIDFPNYDRDQLTEIFFRMAKEQAEYDDCFRKVVYDYFSNISDDILKSKDFSNARFVRNLFERTCAKSGMRKPFADAEKIALDKEDFTLACSDNVFSELLNKKPKYSIGFHLYE